MKHISWSLLSSRTGPAQAAAGRFRRASLRRAVSGPNARKSNAVLLFKLPRVECGRRYGRRPANGTGSVAVASSDSRSMLVSKIYFSWNRPGAVRPLPCRREISDKSPRRLAAISRGRRASIAR
ncbi:hypothetical protein EVAR_100000_1 [Eumeta japonica]|uniref:Uncharacterized protein n=1 Tax=Eumeta variegata TaxID=151549 RepID=A0A4C2A8Y0_EUMVA|nr:hypothetical protein EVAR_100000_1 [Eumeta japonica]